MQPLRSLGRRALSALSLALLFAASTSLAAPETHGRGAATEPRGGGDAKKGAGHEKKQGGEKQKKAGDKGEKEKGPLSIGAPNRGRLVGGVRLKASKQLALREGARTWGLPVLVRALQRAAGRVAKKHGRSTLLVGDLSARKGGQLDGHNSHQTGRDADVGFYAMNSKGKPVPLQRFVAFDAKGEAAAPSWLRFDDARNWALVEALLEDKEAGVRYLFVSNALRGRLLAYAAKKRVSQELLTRAAAALMSPKDADLHDDHFHVRVACPEAMRGACAEESWAREGGAPSLEAGRDPAGPSAGRGAAPAGPSGEAERLGDGVAGDPLEVARGPGADVARAEDGHAVGDEPHRDEVVADPVGRGGDGAVGDRGAGAGQRGSDAAAGAPVAR
jgi:penicillin-insensitive murein endopeptidase